MVAKLSGDLVKVIRGKDRGKKAPSAGAQDSV